MSLDLSSCIYLLRLYLTSSSSVIVCVRDKGSLCVFLITVSFCAADSLDTMIQ